MKNKISLKIFNLLHYNKTSNNGPSQKQTTSVQQMAHLPPIDFTIELIHFEPAKTGTSQLQTTVTDQPLTYLSQHKITSENG